MLSREEKWAFLAFSACGSHFSFCKFDKHLLEICVLLSPSVEEEEWSDGSIQREGMKEKRGGHEGGLRWSWPATRGFSIDRVKLETCPSRISSPLYSGDLWAGLPAHSRQSRATTRHPFLGCFSAASKRKFASKYACFCIKHFCKIMVANFATKYACFSIFAKSNKIYKTIYW